MTLSILAIGDSYLPATDMARALESLADLGTIRYETVDIDDRPELEGVHEYQGSPEAVSGWLSDDDILVVHAAPVTRAVLEAHPSVKLVACVRGGAVNIDLTAAQDLGEIGRAHV